MSEATVTEKEIWRPIPGLEQRYDVSNFGRIRSVSGYRNGKLGSRVWFEGRVLKLSIDKYGYSRFNRVDKVGGAEVRRYMTANVAVLLAFVGPRPPQLQSCHSDGNKSNNRLDNLRWGTAKENCHDRLIHGASAEGEQSHLSRLTEADVRFILANSACETSSLAKRFRVCDSTIRRIITRKSWKHLHRTRR